MQTPSHAQQSVPGLPRSHWPAFCSRRNVGMLASADSDQQKSCTNILINQPARQEEWEISTMDLGIECDIDVWIRSWTNRLLEAFQVGRPPSRKGYIEAHRQPSALGNFTTRVPSGWVTNILINQHPNQDSLVRCAVLGDPTGRNPCGKVA